MYSFTFSKQLETAALSLGFGVLAGIAYDIIRLAVIFVTRSKRGAVIRDICFSLLFTVSSFCFVLAVNNGVMRAYIFIAAALGFFIYYFTFGSLVMRFSDALCTALKKIFSVIFHPLYLFTGAVYDLSAKTAKLIKKTGKKAKKKTNSLLQKNKTVLYNIRKHGAVKQKIRAEKRRTRKKYGKGKKEKIS